MKLILEENDALPGEDERIIHDDSGEVEDTDTKEQNKIDKEVIKELEKRVDYVEDEINDADTPKPEATSGDGKSKGVDGITKAIKIKEKLILPEPEEILSEAMDLTGLDDEEDDQRDLHFVNNRKLAMLGQADDYGYDEYDLDEAAETVIYKVSIWNDGREQDAKYFSNKEEAEKAYEVFEQRARMGYDHGMADIEEIILDKSDDSDDSLDEAIPKDAMTAYKRAPGYNPNDRGPQAIDYQKSNLTEISPEEAQAMVKAGKEDDIRLLIGNKLVKVTGGHGHTDYRDDAVDRTKAYSKKSGQVVRDTRYMPNKHLFQIADKIYAADEKRKDLAQTSARAENPESRYSNAGGLQRYAPAANITSRNSWDNVGSPVRGGGRGWGTTLDARDLQRTITGNSDRWGNKGIARDSAARLRYFDSEKDLQAPTREYNELKNGLRSQIRDIDRASRELEDAKKGGSPENQSKRSRAEQLEAELKRIRKQLALLYYELEDADAEDAQALAAAQDKFDAANANYQNALSRIDQLLGRR